MIYSVALFTLPFLMAETEKLSSEQESDSVAALAILALGPLPSPQFVSPKLPSKTTIERMERNSYQGGDKTRKSVALNNKEEIIKDRSLSVEILPHQDSIPPRVLFIKRNDRDFFSLPVGLNQTPSFKWVGSCSQLVLKRLDEKGIYHRYVSLPRPLGNTRNLLVIFPTVMGKALWRENNISWKLINFDTFLSLKKRVLLINGTERPIGLKLGSSHHSLPARTIQLKSLSYQAQKFPAYKAKFSKGEQEKIGRGSISLCKEAVSILGFYKANPKTNGGRKVGVYKRMLYLPDRFSLTSDTGHPKSQ